MKRNILQIPIDSDLRKKAEREAEDFGFSSLQEMIRVMLTQITKRQKGLEFKVDDICSKYGINYLGLFGSVARGEEKPESDIDLLVKFKKTNKLGLFFVVNGLMIKFDDILMWIAVIFTVYSGIDYINKNSAVINSNK